MQFDLNSQYLCSSYLTRKAFCWVSCPCNSRNTQKVNQSQVIEHRTFNFPIPLQQLLLCFSPKQNGVKNETKSTFAWGACFTSLQTKSFDPFPHLKPQRVSSIFEAIKRSLKAPLLFLGHSRILDTRTCIARATNRVRKTYQ